MGVFTVPIKLKNWQGRFFLPEKRGEEIQCEALVDSGAAELALPQELIERLKLEELGTVRVYPPSLNYFRVQLRRIPPNGWKDMRGHSVGLHTADGGQHEYRVFGIVELEVQGRVCQVRTIELPHGTEPLLGAVPLEEMDWHISPLEKKLIPNPRSPERPLLPLC